MDNNTYMDEYTLVEGNMYLEHIYTRGQQYILVDNNIYSRTGIYSKTIIYTHKQQYILGQIYTHGQ